MKVQERIAEYLMQHNISSETLGARAGIAPARLREIFSSGEQLSSGEYEQIVRALDLTPNTFMIWK